MLQLKQATALTSAPRRPITPVQPANHRILLYSHDTFGLGNIRRYTNTDEFDRVSQNLTAVYRKQLVKRLYSRTTTEVSLKGSSEDREINNNYIFEQQLQYRFASNSRVAALAAYRVKRYPLIEADSNAIDSYVGAKFEQRFKGDRRVELGYRYDHNRAWDPRNNYFRRMYTFEFQTPLSIKRRDLLEARLERCR